MFRLKKQESVVSYDLQGKTLQVYLYLMRRNSPSGIREIQRDLNLSSPSVASYQVEKLVDLGLVDSDSHGRYYLLHKVPVPSLKAYVNLGKLLVPRLTFYAALFTTLLGIYIVLNINSLNIFAVAFGSLGTAVFWYETFRVWQTSPVTVHLDLSSLKPFITERKNEVAPYLVIGTLIILSATAGFDMFSSFVKAYVEEHPEISDMASIDLANINTDAGTYPADRISESIALSMEKMSYATKEGASGPGVPVISADSFSILTIAFPLAGIGTAALWTYITAKLRYK